jgi:hypothetical protein
MMTALGVTSITNFLLACEAFFLAGMIAPRRGSRFSAAWFWGGMMLLLGLSALLGGVDHGFFEAQGLPRYAIQRINWLVIGVVAFLVVMTTACQFFGRRVQGILLVAGLVQLAAYSIVILAAGSFAAVIINYVPSLLFLLVMSAARVRRGVGSWQMMAGIVIMLLASMIQALNVNVFDPLNSSGLYHLVSMVAVVFLYRGGLRLRTAR